MFQDRLRWGILSWIVLVVLVAYFDRVNIAIAAPFLMKELGISPGQLGLIMSGFTIGYTVLNFPAGFILDRFTLRKTYTVMFLLWSVMTFLTGAAWSFMSLMIIRIIFGMCEGPMPVANQKYVNAWMLPSERAFSSGLWMGALAMGVIFGNMLSAVIVDGYGWRSVFYIYGAAGIVLAYVTWMILRDRPEEHPAISKKEAELINTSIARHAGSSAAQATGSSLGQLLTNPWVWILTVVYFSLGLMLWGNLNWLPTYFVKARSSTLLKSGFYATVPWIASFCGSTIMGWLSDHVGKRYRSPWLVLGLLGSAPGLYFAVTAESLNMCLMWFSVAGFFGWGALGIIYSVAMEIIDRADVVKVSGIMLTGGSLAGIVAPTLIGYVLQITNSFNIAYYVFAAASLIGGCISFALIGREKALRRQRQSVS
jgi:sugar phosphate permease